MIGLVFLRLLLQVSFFRIKTIIAYFHSIGMLDWIIQLFISLFSILFNNAGAFFYISFGILKGPGLLLVGSELRVVLNSSSVVWLIKVLKWFVLDGLYILFQIP